MTLQGYSVPETLTDDAGNALKGVTVVVTGPASYTGTAISDTVTGVLRLGPLPIGDYTITLNGRSAVIPVLVAATDVVQLAGDLAGTAASPTVPGLAGKATTAALTAETARATAAEGTNAAAIATNTTALATETTNRTNADALLIPLTQKGAASGVAQLDSGGKIPAVQLPAIAMNTVWPAVASQAAMLALAAQPGDVAVRSDVVANYMLASLPASTLANWVLLDDATGAVTTVAGRTGNVTLAAADVTGVATPTTVSAQIATQATADAGAYVTVIQHGATAATARPAGAIRVFWRGTVAPTNATQYDRWVNTTSTPYAESIFNGTTWDVFGSGIYVPKWKPFTNYTAGDPVVSPSGPIVTANVTFTSGASYSAANWTPVNVPLLVPLEAVNAWCYGHSYFAPNGTGLGTGAHTPERVASRLRTLPLTNRAVNSTTALQICNAIQSTWTPAQGLVMLVALYNSINQTVATGDVRETLRTALAILTAGVNYQETDTPFAFTGTWVAGPTGSVMGGTSLQTVTVGDSVDISVNGDAANIRTMFESGTGAVITVTLAGTGATLATVNTGGYGAAAVPAVIPLSGLGAGVHTVRATFTSGTKLIIDGVSVPSSTPPVVVYFEEGAPNPAGTATGVSGVATNLPSYKTALTAMLATYPSVLVLDGNNTGWDNTTDLQLDGAHPNARGVSKIVAGIVDLLRGQSFSQSLDSSVGTPFTDTPTVPAYYVGSPTAPAQVTGLTAAQGASSITLNWTRPSNGGAVITDYTVQYRTTTGPGAWTTFTHTASTATTSTVTGLTNGTSYDFQVAAVNSVGQGTYSAAATQSPTAAANSVTDNYTRANGATGTMSDGFHSYATPSGTAPTIVSNKLTFANGATVISVATPALPSRPSTIQDTLSAQADGGLIFRYQDTSNFFRAYTRGDGTYHYAVQRVLAGVTTNVIAAQTGHAAAAPGDVIKITDDGTNITLFVNGTSYATVADTNLATATGVGHYGGSVSASGCAWTGPWTAS